MPLGWWRLFTHLLRRRSSCVTQNGCWLEVTGTADPSFMVPLPFGILLEEPFVLLITDSSVQIAKVGVGGENTHTQKNPKIFLTKWKIKYAFKILLKILLSLLKIKQPGWLCRKNTGREYNGRIINTKMFKYAHFYIRIYYSHSKREKYSFYVLYMRKIHAET